MKNTEENKKIVSPFEFAIAEAIDPEYAKTMRPETQEELETEALANAKLIAAAPEMFNALKTILEIYESEGQLLSFDVNIAREVLKKVTE